MAPNLKIARSLAVMLLVPLAGTAAAQTPVPHCAESAAGAVIHIAVCAAPATDAELAAEGRRICGDDLPCGTWFWRDAADAPVEAPENHDGLTPEQIQSAMGVYVAEQDMLVRIERDGG